MTITLDAIPHMSYEESVTEMEISAEVLWGAASYANTLTNGFVGYNSSPGCITTADVLLYLLKNNVTIPEEGIEEGKNIRQYLNGLMFRLLAGKYVGDFLKKGMNYAQNDIHRIIGGNLRVIATLPSAVQTDKIRSGKTARLCDTEHSYIGNIDDNVSLTITVFKVQPFTGNDFTTNYVTGITNDNHAVVYATNNPELMKLDSTINCKAKVKKHEPDKYHGFYTTRLYYVKFVSNSER